MSSMYPRILAYSADSVRDYATVGAVTVVAAFVEFAIEEFVGSRQPLLLLWPCVLLAAYLGGFRLGAFATLVSVPAIVYFLIDPPFDFGVQNKREWLWVGVFILLGLSVSVATAKLRRRGAVSRALDESVRDLAVTVDLRQAPSPKGRSLFPECGSEPIPGYRLISPVGRGGTGEVWKSANPDGVTVALKFIPWTQKAADAEVKIVEAMKAIRHPHLLSMFDHFWTREYLIIVMELADCTLLDRWWQGVSLQKLQEAFHQAAEGIDFLHDQSIQHRDIKPQNLLMIGNHLKVADFGLSRIVSHSTTRHTGQMTVAYAAPEYFEGRTSKHSDQYGLAISYCQLRGGRLPFVGSAAQIVGGHLNLPPDLSMLPEQERSVVARALSKQPNERWPTCGDFVNALARR